MLPFIPSSKIAGTRSAMVSDAVLHYSSRLLGAPPDRSSGIPIIADPVFEESESGRRVMLCPTNEN
jgi:hypothetical protein